MINTPTLKDQEQVDSYNEELIDNSTNKEISYSMERSNISAVTYSDKVELNWSDIPTENNEYEILRDGEHLETVEGNEYVDDTIEQDEMYRYTVVGNKKLPQDRIDEIEMELEENDIQLSEEEKQQALYEPKETNVIINASEGDGESNSLSSDINQDDDWHLRYTSFIPMEYGENPWCTVSCTYDYFGGDDRGLWLWRG
ncbi:hypothetical protein EPH95_10785 [Salicibibacter halophilus]|uniref:Uncharacterized protein n=2 Tax=Salicibibacter halophilus TaxID=2502791 RepID=A0A514LIB6_9BACI|nr:hypothetical protein EPH95_10785 [Salicibibacter halophilus]